MAGLPAVVAFAAAIALAGRPAPGAPPPDIPSPCRAALDARLPGWKVSPPPPGLREWAAARREVTNVVTGDFDDDGARDTAVLVAATRKAAGVPRLAVCLAHDAQARLFLIDAPYGRDGISLTRKGTRDYDHESRRTVRYRTDGVHAYTFEKSGATYLFRRGGWIRIVDSD